MLCFRCGSYNPENAQKCSVCGQGFIDEAGKVVGPPRRESKTTTPAAIFVPGEMVAGRYRIGELLGQGGVGAVYRARDLEIDVDIALKGITPNLLQTDEEQKNFSKQIKGARKLQHPNIVRIYDEGHEGTRRFFTMKLLEGLTLRKIIRLRHEKGQPFTAEELVPIFHQLGAALDYAHKSTWHGDLKPENIIILPDLLKITDFNLVKALPLKPFLGIAKSRSKGFPYIAPELRVEAQNIDGRADTYALGVILGEMLTGLVFEGHYTRAMTAALEQLPTKLDGLVRKAVTEHPDGRFQRATDLAKELEAALGAMTTPLPAPAKPPALPASGAVTAPNPVQKSAQPQLPPPIVSEPPKSPLAPPLSARTPPASDADTGPLQAPPPLLSSDETLRPGEQDELPREPSEILEIGQSQVLLLQSGVTSSVPSAEALADAARRLLAAQSNPEDTLDEASQQSDIDTAPRGAPIPKEIVVEARKGVPSQRPHDPEKLVEALYSDEHDDGLIPPPLPDDSDAGINKDDSDEGPTDEHPMLAKEKNEKGQGEIHDALTALKPHPADLLDAGPRAARAAEKAEKDRKQDAIVTGDMSKERTDKVRDRPRAPAFDDEDPDSLKETLSAEVLRAAKERSSPRLHRADPLPPPVIAPPPVLRPVSPPRRPQQSSGSIAFALILGVVIVATGVVVWRFGFAGKDDKDRSEHVGDHSSDHPDHDHATVTPGKPDAIADAGVVADAKPVVDDTKPKVDDTKPVIAKIPDDHTAKTPDDHTAKTPDDHAAAADAGTAAPVIASVAATGTCPSGMVLIPGATFVFGSDPSDSMRNFGEANASNVDVASYCIDYYEAPNSKKSPPTVGVSWNAARDACDRAKKRLCSEKEWEHACKGPASTRFPYGNGYEVDTCNTNDAAGKPRPLAAPLAFVHCRSPFKTFMMSGNAEEWVADSVNGKKIAKGGSADRPDFSSRCAARRAPDSGQLGMVGFRCCADPK